MKKDKSVVLKLIEREREYCDTLTVGSDEYVESCKRLMELEKQLENLKDQKNRTVIEGVKVAGGIVLPVFGWIVITAFEKDDSITSSLKRTIDCFIPRRN